MPRQPEHVVVIGAGLGGVRTAEQLRAAGCPGRISLVGAELHPPYDRPPLSKQILTGDWEPERAVLRTEEALDELGVRLYLGRRAVALRPGVVELSDGASLHGDAIVVATGLEARRVPGQPDAVHTLRTLDDALALRADLDRISSLLIIGAGFVGAEVASAARARGIAVTVLEALPVPSSRALGPQVGALAARLMLDAGVDLRVDTELRGFVESPVGIGVELRDGTRLDADAALVGIGGVARLDWITAQPDTAPPATTPASAVPDPAPPDPALPVSAVPDTAQGLACGPTGRVHGLDAVWGVGDVAVWDDPGRAAHRHEHWTSASDQAAVVARDILGVAAPAPTVPYFWSDQFGLKIQVLGRPELADAVLPLHGTGLDGGPVRGTVAAYLDGHRLVAVVGFGAARFLARYRASVAAGATRDEVLATAVTLAG